MENLRKQHELLKKMLEQQEQLRALQGRQEALLAMQHSAEQALAVIEDTGETLTATGMFIDGKSEHFVENDFFPPEEQKNLNIFAEENVTQQMGAFK